MRCGVGLIAMLFGTLAWAQSAGDVCAPGVIPEELAASDYCDTARSLLCVPDGWGSSSGTCQRVCERNGSAIGGVCPQPETCQDVAYDSDDSTVVGVCRPVEQDRNGECLSPGDLDACAAPLVCTSPFVDRLGAAQSQCRRLCAVANECPAGESCLTLDGTPGPVRAADPGGAPLPCEQPDILGTDSCASDQVCAPSFVPGEWYCHLPQRVCGVASRSIQAVDVGTDYGAVRCDGEDTYCLDPRYAGTALAPSCYGGTSLLNASGPDAAFCLAICSSWESDGSGGYAQRSVACPSGMTCRTDLAASIGLGAPIFGSGGLDSCGLDACVAGQACPVECDAPQALCVDARSSTQAGTGMCVLPFGVCEPDAAPPTDAGSLNPDHQGPPDAGAVAVDVTPGSTDSGSAGGTAEGCGCSTGQGARGLAPGLLLVLMASGRRRRNRWQSPQG